MAANWENQLKPNVSGNGWEYDENGLSYDELIEEISELVVKYDGQGTPTTWTLQAES